MPYRVRSSAVSGPSHGTARSCSGAADIHRCHLHSRPERAELSLQRVNGGTGGARPHRVVSVEVHSRPELCGLLSSLREYVRWVFDLLTLFQYFRAGTLPPPGEVPSAFRPTPEMMQKVTDALKREPAAATLLYHRSGANNAEELGAVLTFHTDLMRDVQSRCGGNPTGNQGTVYVAGPESVAVNRGVRRVAAAKGAAACLMGMQGPRGTLTSVPRP